MAMASKAPLRIRLGNLVGRLGVSAERCRQIVEAGSSGRDSWIGFDVCIRVDAIFGEFQGQWVISIGLQVNRLIILVVPPMI
jgi:hypothetical protein